MARGRVLEPCLLVGARGRLPGTARRSHRRLGRARGPAARAGAEPDSQAGGAGTEQPGVTAQPSPAGSGALSPTRHIGVNGTSSVASVGQNPTGRTFTLVNGP